jgi:hypothetical protein
MTEKEYINLTDLNKLQIALSVLREICPANSDIINEKELQKCTSKLYEWVDLLREKYDISE